MTNIDERPGGEKRRDIQPIIWGCIGGLVIITVFLIGLGAGYGFGRWSDDPDVMAQNTPSGGEADPDALEARGELDDSFQVFWESMDLLYRDYYGSLPEGNDATYGAIRGVLNLLEDPNTSFMTPEEAEAFRTHIQGSFEGIGARVEWDEEADTVRISEPFENQPAWEAGIRRGDLVLAVDGENVVGTNLTDAVAMIRGPKGSVVILTIRRADEADEFEIEVTRDRIEMPTISVENLGEAGDIVHIRLNAFNENAGKLVRDAIADAIARDPRGIVFDLRGNTGGLLREAVAVTGVFLEDQVALIERFADGTEETYSTEGEAIIADIPLVVLVNEGSASASEIVAGALQDAGRATLIGSQTFGKGSVQLPHTLSNGAIMRVTIARWFTPADRSIDGVGLEPDMPIEISDEQREAGEDPQLDAALELLQDGE